MFCLILRILKIINIRKIIRTIKYNDKIIKLKKTKIRIIIYLRIIKDKDNKK